MADTRAEDHPSVRAGLVSLEHACALYALGDKYTPNKVKEALARRGFANLRSIEPEQRSSIIAGIAEDLSK